MSSFAYLQVDKIIVPATTGQMGVLPGHVATIADLKPGVLSVHEENDVTKYLVNSGFAYVHANSIAEIVAVEAVPLDQIDPSLVQMGLTEFAAKLASASTDLEKTEAQDQSGCSQCAQCCFDRLIDDLLSCCLFFCIYILRM